MKPETTRVTARPSPTLFSFQKQSSVLQLFKKETPTFRYSCEYWKIFKNTYFEKQLRTAAFAYLSCLSTIIFLIHTELLPHVQRLLVRDIICVIYVDKKM